MKNENGKTWHSGIWTKKLQTVARGKGVLGGKIAIVTRAKYILMKRQGLVSRPTKGMGCYPFEEEIELHCHEALVVMSTGSPHCFFANPFVKNWLRKMDPRHRPIYRAKLGKLVCCVNDVLSQEVR